MRSKSVTSSSARRSSQSSTSCGEADTNEKIVNKWWRELKRKKKSTTTHQMNFYVTERLQVDQVQTLRRCQRYGLQNQRGMNTSQNSGDMNITEVKFLGRTFTARKNSSMFAFVC